MPRHLVLVRHAKSSWDDPRLSDFDRPLAPRGVSALPRMSAHLTAGGASPDLVLCSPATRTRETLAGVRAALSDSASVEFVDAIYGAGTRELLGLVGATPAEVGCLMVVGHNPGMQDLAVALVGSGDDDLRQQLREKYPTGAIATLSFDREWPDLDRGDAHLDDLFLPRRPRT